MSHIHLCDMIMNDDDYEENGKIGRGSFGKVYEVSHKETGKTFALKVGKKSEKLPAESLYFLREVSTLAAIKHPAIMSLESFSLPSCANNSKMLTEYCEKGSLEMHICQRDGPPKWLDDTAKMIIMAGTAAAIAHLHSRNIIHRDIKPANILLTKEYYPKISDFGLARFYDKEEHPEMTNCGTRVYMAPEYYSTSQLSEKTDVFALSFFFYELLTNLYPFHSIRNESDIIIGKRPVFPSNFKLDNEELVNMIISMWDFNPDARPSAYLIFSALRMNKYILPKTDMKKYMEYYEMVEKCTDPVLDYEYKVMKTLADNGDQIEQFNIYRYFIIDETEKSLKDTAIKYLTMSAEQNFPQAMYTLGMELLKDNDESSNKRAFAYIKKAASMMLTPAIYQFGIMIRDAIGLDDDFLKITGKERELRSHNELKRAGCFGYMDGFLELAYMSATGHGSPKDFGVARNFLNKVKEGDVDAEKLKMVKELIG